MDNRSISLQLTRLNAQKELSKVSTKQKQLEDKLNEEKAKSTESANQLAQYEGMFVFV